VEAIVAVIIAAAAAMAVIGDAKDTVHGTHGSADASADNASDRTADRACNTVTFIGAFLGAADDPLGVTGLRQAGETEKDGSACEEQAGRTTGRQRGGGDTNSVHYFS
jgi:hypothetical protein